jgi:glycosyltransferase involved in cell wall biosynthesis
VRAASERVGVLHITDTLEPGGMERVAVNLVNALPRDRFVPSLCTTRRGGPLSDLVAPDVARVDLARRRTLDVRALARLAGFIRSHHVGILHAHGSSLFTAIAASYLPPYPAVVWHDHCGFHETAPRSVSVYRAAVSRVSGVIAVNELLAKWARTELGVREDRVWYVPNFIPDERPAESVAPRLPGLPGTRVVCVANLRPQKSHVNLVRAFAHVAREFPQAHLLLVGREADRTCADLVRAEILARDLGSRVTMLGERADVAAILRQCDVGVLSSISEGFPLALVEYGQASLPVVATNVGQCAEVLDHGEAGTLVAAADPAALAAAIADVLRSPERGRRAGERLHERVRGRYGAGAVVEQISRVYDTLAQPSLSHA